MPTKPTSERSLKTQENEAGKKKLLKNPSLPKLYVAER